MVAARDIFRSRAFIVGIAQSLAWVGVGVTLMLYVPKYEKMFREFSVALPAVTVFVFNVGHHWYLALPLLAAWPFVNVGVVSVLSPRPDVVVPRRLWYVVTWLVIPLVVAFAVTAVAVPLMGLIHSLAHPPH